MNNQIRVLIADANESFTAQLSGFLGENPAFVVAGVANDGEKAVELLHTVQADLLILDLLLPKLDGISVLKAASALPKPPIGLALTGFMTEYAAQAAEKYGVRYFISKPCGLQTVAERALEIVDTERTAKRTRYPQANVEALVTSMIHEIGVPAHVKGYQYLREAIMIAVDDMDHEGSLSAGCKEVFHDVLESRARHPACHRAGLGQGRPRDPAKILRLYRLQHQGQADEL